MNKFKVMVFSIFVVFVFVGCIDEKKANKLEVNYISFGEVVESLEVKKGEIVKEPILPRKSEYSFFGWYLDEKFSKEYYFNEEVNENLNLYARWLKASNLEFFEYEIIDSKLTITDFDYKNHTDYLIVFPQIIDDQQVQAIHKGVHSIDDKVRRTIMVPFGVEVIGEASFKDSNNLDEIFLPRTIKYLEADAFSAARINVFYFPSFYTEKKGGSSNSPLRDAIINDFYFPGDGKAFKLDSYISLTICNLIMHDDIEVIKEDAFRNALGLKVLNVKFPKNLKKLEGFSLTGIVFANKLYFPDSIEEIQPNALFGVARVFKIPENTKEIKSYAYLSTDCVYIHSNIEYFEKGAFSSGTVLFIDLEGPKDTWDKDWNDNYKVYWLKDILGE